MCGTIPFLQACLKDKKDLGINTEMFKTRMNTGFLGGEFS
jgi:hypothetical protein